MIYGLDIGGSKMEIAAFDREFGILDRWRRATPCLDYEAFLSAVVALVEEADGRFGAARSIGLGLPGLIDADGRSLCANVPCATGRHVASDLAARLRRPVAVENDCRCFALSEAVGGAGEGFRRVFGAILGTGAAGGLVLGGVLERGAQGIAGEYGHFPLPAALAARRGLPLVACGCGGEACVEPYISGPGLSWLARHYGLERTEAPAVVQAWRAGERRALEVRDCFVDVLGATFATVCMMVDPDVIVLGGGVSLIDEVVEELPGSIARHLFRGFASPPVVRARFGDSSGVRGSAILAGRLVA